MDEVDEENEDWTSDNGTDTDTASSLGETKYNMDDVAHLSPKEQEQEIMWQSEHAKGRRRQMFRKPTRKV